MKKNFFVILMVVTMLAGVVLAMTPFVMNALLPPDKGGAQMALGERARAALADWFVVEPDDLSDVQAYREQNAETGRRKMYFSWSTDADTVRNFIIRKRLKQQALTEQVMQETFANDNISWWQPQALGRETWFGGHDGQAALNLIYNAKTRRGVLLVIPD